MRYLAAAALVREVYSKRRRSCLWSKPVNMRTWRLVPDPIVMVHAFAELRYGVVVHTRENSLKYGHNFNHTLYNYSIVTGITKTGPRGGVRTVS